MSTVDVPATIDPTGASDVTAALTGWIATAAPGTVLRLAAGATYRVDGTVKMQGRRDVILDGNGATFDAQTRGDMRRCHLLLATCQRVEVRNLSISGANPLGGTTSDAYDPAYEHQHGVRLEGCTDVTLSALLILDTYGDCVYVGPSGAGAWCNRMLITGSVLGRNGRQGVAVTCGRNVVITRSIIAEIRRAALDCEPNTASQGAEDIYLLDNWIGAGRLRLVAAHGNGPVNRLVVARNVCMGRDLAIDVKARDDLDRRAGFWIVGNRSDIAATSTPFRLYRLDDVTMDGNYQRMRDLGDPVASLASVCGWRFVDNDVPGPDGQQAAILVTGSPCDSESVTYSAMPEPPTVKAPRC